MNWHRSAREWSIAECFDHLLVTGRGALERIDDTIRTARAKGLLLRSGPFHYGVIEKWMVRLLEPPPRRKLGVPRGYVPSPNRPCSEVVPAFLRLQDAFLRSLLEANGVDLAKARASSPRRRWLTFSLEQYLALHAAHERRHLWQARQIRGSQEFPRAVAGG